MKEVEHPTPILPTGDCCPKCHSAELYYIFTPHDFGSALCFSCRYEFRFTRPTKEAVRRMKEKNAGAHSD